MATKYKYDKDTDYAALMERAAQRGDNAAAAIYEQQRNAKIRGEGMTDVTQSNDYAQYLPLEDVPDYDDTHRRQAESLLTERDTTGQRARIDQARNSTTTRHRTSSTPPTASSMSGRRISHRPTPSERRPR